MCAEKSDLDLFICMLMYKKWDVPNKSQGPVQRALLFASELSNRNTRIAEVYNPSSPANPVLRDSQKLD
jgi:hypothetical protein